MSGSWSFEHIARHTLTIRLVIPTPYPRLLMFSARKLATNPGTLRALSSLKSLTNRLFSSNVVVNKVYKTAAEAVAASGLKDGDKLLAGGFGLSGIPMTTINAIHAAGVKDLTVVSNNCGTDYWGLGILLNSKRIRRMVSSYVGENEEFQRQYLEGELEVELTPQGTLAEKLRAGGAGIPAFYTRTGVGTDIQFGGVPIKYTKTGEVVMASKPKDVRVFDGKTYLLEESIRGDVSIIKGWRADKYGNIQFRGTARNFNPDVAMAGRFCIAEVDEIVEIGEIKPEDVHLSGGFVHAIVLTDQPKKIERLTERATDEKPVDKNSSRYRMARRASLEVKPGMKVNLGIGVPTEVSNHIPEEMKVMFQSENGLLGMGPFPNPGEADADYINAGKQTITVVPGASIFSSSESFAMIRGGHVDVTILGGLEVAQNGDLANWVVPKQKVKGMGGAMDLVACGSRVIVTLEHCNKKGQSKILKRCALPLTGQGVADLIITDLAVFEVDKKHEQLILIEKLDSITIDELKAKTEANFIVSPNLTTYRQ